MEIKLTNTLTREKETFNPIKQGEVGIYSCGPTVYNYAHIGNLRAFVFADILKRMFLFNGYKVKHIMNITDVGHLTSDADEGEDKLEKGAKREGKTVWEVADYYTKSFLDDIKQLNIILPDKLPKATEHIKEMIEIIKKLEKNGFTYISEGNVYFDTSRFEDYGKMAKLKLDSESSQSRVEHDPHKKNPFDFVLWFTRYKYINHEMMWDSPWGRGFPGWHIECSAMSTRYLGEQFDIHTGGIDHIPVHHTNEIAQSECAFGHKWVNYWLHSDFLVTSDNEKIAKSKDNFLRLKTLTDKGYLPEEYRYFILGTHYKKQLAFSFEAMDSAKNTFKKLKNRMLDLQNEKSDGIEKDAFDSYISEFKGCVNDDLNTPKALAVMWDVIGNENLNAKTKLSIVGEFDRVFGLGLAEIKEDDIPSDILKLKDERDAARKNKNWKLSDELRNRISDLGYDVFDSKEGSELRKK